MNFKNDYLIKSIIETRGKKIVIVLLSIFILPIFEVSQLIIFTSLTSELIGNTNESNGLISRILGIWTNYFLKLNIDPIPSLAILLAIFAIFSVIIGLSSSYLRSRMTYSIKAYVQSELFNLQLYNSWTEHTDTDRASQYQKIKMEPGRFASGIVNPLLELCAQLILGISIIVYSAITVPELTAMSFLLFSALFYFAFYITGSQLEHFNQQAHILGIRLFRRFDNALRSFKETKLYSLENTFFKLFFEDQLALSRAATFQSTFSKASRYLLEATAFITLSSVIALTFIFELNNENLLQSLSIFGICLLKLVPIFNSMFGSLSLFKSNSTSYIEINKEFKRGIERKEAQKKQIGEIKKIENIQHIILDNVHFSYGDSKILKGISLRIDHGKSYGIVGSSGSGKTTLIDLITGLIKPSAGKLYINNIDSNEVDIRSWMKNIGLVMQDVNIFNGTLLDNIIFFNERENTEENRKFIEKICEQTSLVELINSRDGLDTIVGDDGIKISGGQKQRLGIARAIYRRASLLVFDEATSALDSITERSVLDTFNNIKGSATTVTIAHRVQTLKDVDEIWVLKDGVIDAIGNYDSLMGSNALFKDLSGLH